MSIFLSGCAQPPPAPESMPSYQLSVEEGMDTDAKLYRIHAGDALRITVFEEEDLSGPYNVNGDGAISYPLIGPVMLEGLSVYEAEDLLEDRLRDGYLKHPDISIDVTQYRPFSVLGEVVSAGNYEYREGVSVADAIAMSGGFTPQAERQQFETLRRSKEGWQRVYTRMNDRVAPGDIIYIGGRGGG